MEHFEVQSKNPKRDIVTPEEHIGAVQETLVTAYKKVVKTGREILEQLDYLEEARKEREVADDPDYIRELTEAIGETEKTIEELKDFREAQREGGETLQKIWEELVAKNTEAKKTLLTTQKSMRNIIRFVISVGIAELAGVVGASYTTPNLRGWYAFLAKPALTPPSWVFGPVWTLLYFLMGIAVFLVWSSFIKASDGQRRRNGREAIGVFAIQLILNILWSVTFFGSQSLLPGFIVIVSLWLTIIASIAAFGKISRAAAWILVPYLLWVTFAMYLNFSIWALNR